MREPKGALRAVKKILGTFRNKANPKGDVGKLIWYHEIDKPAMKLRVYLDTSVFSAYFDDRVTDRQAETELFWQRLNQYEVSTSELAHEELLQTNTPDLRAKLLKMLEPFFVHPVTPEMKELARFYIAGSAFSPVMFNDALHVAAAVMTRQDVLLSWNFKHLVNRRRRAIINQLNISKGLPTVDIIAPPEI